MVAVFILTLSLASLLTLTSSSVFSARYAKNDITANYLLQEVADYIRNDRDGSLATCFLANGCYFEPASISVVPPTACPSGVCPTLGYDDGAINNDFYTYRNPAGFAPSVFQRKVLMKINNLNSDELDITVIVTWNNGGLALSRSLHFSLLNWQK